MTNPVEEEKVEGETTSTESQYGSECPTPEKVSAASTPSYSKKMQGSIPSLSQAMSSTDNLPEATGTPSTGCSQASTANLSASNSETEHVGDESSKKLDSAETLSQGGIGAQVSSNKNNELDVKSFTVPETNSAEGKVSNGNIETQDEDLHEASEDIDDSSKPLLEVVSTPSVTSGSNGIPSVVADTTDSTDKAEDADTKANYPWDDQRSCVRSLRASSHTDSVEKPNRIFQQPPEEYLPVLDEDPDEDELEGLPTPPDGGWGWVVVFGSFMIHVFADGFTYTLGIFYVHFLNYYGVSKSAASWVASILVGMTLGSGPISGALVNKYGCRAVTIGGALLASFMLFLSVYAESIYTLYFTIGIGAGLGFGLIYLPAIVCVTGYFEKKRSFATGIAVCGSGMGTFIFSPMVELLIKQYTWKGAFIVISGLMLNCVVFGALFRPLEKPRRRRVVQTRPVSHYSTAGSMDSPHPLSVRPPLPSIQRVRRASQHVTYEITDEDEHRKHRSTTCLDAKDTTRQRYLSVSTGHHGADLHPVDLHRIASHGSLNPVLATIRRGEAGLRTTASQPLFARDPRDHSPTKIGASHSGFFHRKDAHVNGSILLLAEQRKEADRHRDSLQHGAEQQTPTDSAKVCGCISVSTVETIKSYFPLELVTDPIFIIFAVSNFFTSIGFNAPYIFIMDRALDLQVPAEQAAKLLSVLGLSNTASRVLLGYISDKDFVNRLYLYNGALTLCGVATCVSIWTPSLAGQAVYAAIFGCTSGAYVGLTSVVLVDLMGMEKLTDAFGLLLLVQGIASVIGPPLCGSLYSVSASYDYPFLLAGFMIALSGIMLFAVPCLQRYVARRQQQKLRQVS